MLFSNRKGYKSISQIIQKDDVSISLRNSLWNVLDLFVWSAGNFLDRRFNSRKRHMEDFSKALWFGYFKKPIDTRPSGYGDILQQIRKYFFSSTWYEIYDFIEWTLNYLDDSELTDLINNVLEKELSAFRFVGGIFTDITDSQEIEMLEIALADDDFPGVQKHLQRALELLSNRENPDFRNSIKESISAVEALARIITGDEKSTLGDALKIIERQGKLHGSIKDAFSKLYGYASDEGGIRHAMLDEPNLSVADAKYFLFSCTSFINYMKSKL